MRHPQILPGGRAVHALTLTKGLEVEATLFADGGSRGNPGPAASGAVLLDNAGEQIGEVGAYLGVATNNVAEWTALLLGLEAAAERGIRRLAVRLDSELVVKQLRGEYRVKHADLQPLYKRAVSLLRRFEEVDVQHVPRKQNSLADRLVNRVLDQEAGAPAK
jgi:ribonuclease HI